MNLNFRLLFAVILCSMTATAQCPLGLSGIFKIGPSGSYPTLTAALMDLHGKGIAGPVLLELQATYTSTVETFPIVLKAVNCASKAKYITIRPESGAPTLTITTNDSIATLDLNNGFNNPASSAYIDLHLQNGTPAESSGTTEYTTLTDIDGKTRAQYTPVDIGADAGNFNGVPPTPPPPDTTTSTTPTTPADSTIVVPYPNPFSSTLTLALTADTAGTAHVRIYSLTGKLVAAINLTVVTGTNIIAIPTAAFPDGIYVLRVFIDNKRQTMEIQKKTD